ncbi:rhomboid family intramembrane serine protease [Brevundimonas sp. VNH65]|uniref:rhomboid family intramembrane serine protease n=1 Tax=Brevundimonas sp. VNH65 TaxID=3400917 RepID=UPI003C0F7774
MTEQTPPPREKMINAPLAPVVLAASIPVLYFLQTLLPDEGLVWAFRPVSLTQGGWWPGVVTSMALHAGWTHALINAAFALAFGPPVARLFAGARGAMIFFAYYIVCGLAGSLGFGLMHLNDVTPMVGASGAVTGLLGGAVRLLGGDGRLKPLTDRGVLTTSAAILGINLVTGLVGYTPGVESAGIAWEAHAFGYLAGLLLIGPLYRAFGRKEETAIAAAPSVHSGPWSG